jgi:hypothetical protein
MKAANVSALDVQQVFDRWRQHRPRPELCRLTTDRAKLIRDRLALGYTAADFVALVDYVFTSDDDWCRFMRGGNDRGKDYTGLDSILRKEKLADRVERALLWSDEAAGERKRREQTERTGVDLGALGAFKSGRTLPEA